MEIWKNVVGFEGIYQVSNLGNVKVLENDVDYGNRICHRRERILKQHNSSDGYPMVKLKDNRNHNVHRLVAEAFLGVEQNMEVDHINAIRTDNRIENLRWVTHSENIKHTYEMGNGYLGGSYSNNHNAKPVTIQHINSGDEICFGTIKECAEWFKSNLLKDTKIKSIYDSLRKHNINHKPYMGFKINY